MGSFSCPFLISIFFFKIRGGAELAGGEVFQGAEACVEFGRRQAPLAVERARKLGDGNSGTDGMFPLRFTWRKWPLEARGKRVASGEAKKKQIPPALADSE